MDDSCFSRLLRLFCLVPVLFATFGLSANAQTNAPGKSLVSVRIVTSSGSVFVSEVEDFSFRFHAINDAGEGLQRDFRLSEIAFLNVVVQPEADSISVINEWIHGLSSPDYHRRQEAGEKLAGESSRQEVRTLLEKATKHELLEVRYRAERLLSTAGAPVKPEQERWDYDRIRLKDGTEFRGDAGKFSIGFVSRGGEIELARGELRSIVAVESSEPESGTPIPYQLPMLKHEFQDQKFPVWLDFETGIGNRKLLRTANIATEFSDQGLLLRGQVSDTDKSGAILVSPYAFNFESKPTGGNSICVSRDPVALRSPHKGITMFGFCLPHQPGRPAGVNRLGMFGARNEYAFSFVLQCFNEDGQLLGEAASTDESCSWFEIESAEPVVTARFLATPLGLRMELPIDEDYALDNLGMSLPVAAMPIESMNSGMVSLRNGETIHVSQISVGQSGIAAQEQSAGRMIQFDWGEIAWWILPGSEMLLPRRGDVRWFAMLDDRSILEVKWSAGKLVPVRLDDITIDRQSLVCLWTGQDWCRFPQAADFDYGKGVLVFPGCRLAVPDVTIDENGLSWVADESVALFQPLKVTERAASVEDPTGKNLAVNSELAPKFDKLAWVEVAEWNLPTVWFRQPTAPDSSQGSISLTTGEKIVFGPKSRYRLDSSSGQGATLVDASGTAVFLDWKNVWRMKMPDMGG